MQKLTIGFFTDEYLPRLHGVTTSILSYKHALEELGHTVYIVTLREAKYHDAEPNVIRLPSMNPVLFRDRRVVLLYPGIARKLRSVKFDIVHSHTHFGVGLLAHSVAQDQNIPHVTTMHTIYSELAKHYPVGTVSAAAIMSVVYPLYFRTRYQMSFEGPQDASDTLTKKQLWRALMLFLNSVDLVLSPSRHLADKLKHFGLKTPLGYQPNGVNLAEYARPSPSDLPPYLKQPKTKARALVLGRLSGEKRQDVLIRAAVLLPDNIELLIAGEGIKEKDYRELAEDLNVTDKVIFLGQLSPRQVKAALKDSDMMILASHNFDNAPVVIMEAIAAGLPIIYCDKNLHEGLNKSNSLLCGTSARSFAHCIQKLASDENLRRRMGKASLSKSQQFDINKLAEKLVQTYRQAMARPRLSDKPRRR